MKNEDRRKHAERFAWQAFVETGEIGAYLKYCAVRDANSKQE